MIFPGDESDTLISGHDERDRQGASLVTFISGGDRRLPGPWRGGRTSRLLADPVAPGSLETGIRRPGSLC